MPIKEKNLKKLQKEQPQLYEIYLSGDCGGVETLQSKSGLPVFKFKDVAVHSLYKPEEEASRFASGIDTANKNIWLFGLGYGYHLAELIKRDATITIIEPSAEIFRSAVENIDLTEILDRCTVVVGSSFRTRMGRPELKSAHLAAFRPYLRFFESGYKNLETAFRVREFVGRKNLKVMLVGALYGGSVTTFRYVQNALERIGVEVVPFDATHFASAFFKIEDLTPNKAHQQKLQSLFANMLGEGVAAMAEHIRPDLLLGMAQAPMDIATLKHLKKMKIPSAFWFVEDFRTLDYWKRMAPHYDYFFTIQRGEFIDELKKIGANHVAYLPQAASPESHRPVELTEAEKTRYGSKLSFMGSGYFNRKNFFKGLLDYDFKIWGTEWDLDTQVGKRVQNANNRMDPEEYVKIFSASKINLNLHSSNKLEGIDPMGDFVNPRVFELAACGAFSLVDNRAELASLMEPGREIETFSSLNELREKIDYYLKHKDERLKIAAAGRQRVLRDHTFENRMEELLAAVIEGEGDSFPPEKKRSGSPNLVQTMMEEGADDPELLEFLKKFKPDEMLTLEKIKGELDIGKGGFSRVESLMYVVGEVLEQK